MKRHKLNKSRKGPYFLLIGPYDEGIRDALKREIPARARAWDPSLKAWRIDEPWERQAQAIIDDLSPEAP